MYYFKWFRRLLRGNWYKYKYHDDIPQLMGTTFWVRKPWKDSDSYDLVKQEHYSK